MDITKYLLENVSLSVEAGPLANMLNFCSVGAPVGENLLSTFVLLNINLDNACAYTVEVPYNF